MPLSADILLQSNFSTYVKPFELHAGIVGRQSAKLRQIFQRFLVSTAIDKPSWREGQEDDADSEDKSWDDLQEEG